MRRAGLYMGGDTSKTLFSTDGQSPGLRFASEVGLRIAPARLPMAFAMHNRFERFDSAANNLGRLEELDAVGVSVGFRIGR